MKFKKAVWWVCCFFIGWSHAQDFILPPNQKVEKIRFELTNNLVIIPVELNGAQLNFLLDSGVSNPILFNLTNQDSLQINSVSEITLRGLGNGEPVKALKSIHNKFKVGNAVNFDQKLYVILDKDLNFSTSLGTNIHGVIGFDVFKSFVVEVNYGKKWLKLFNPKGYHYKQGKNTEILPLRITNKKAYVEGSIDTEKENNIPVRLLVDTGSSDALWLFHDPEQGLEIPDEHYEDFLGIGLNGTIYGKRTKIKGFKLGSFSLLDAKTAFPYRESIGITDLGKRNGSVGGEVLKRFNLVFDYQKQQIALKKNGHFKAPFHYNHSGIELQHNGMRYIAEQLADANGLAKSDESDTYGNVQLLMQNRTRLSLVPEIVVSAIRAGSPAEQVGLKKGDVILAVNGKEVHGYKLQEILHLINQKKGKRIRLMVQRYNKDLVFNFTVKDLFAPK